MVINKSKGNMYKFVTHTFNTIKGVCLHNCQYCYMKRFPQKPIRLDTKEFTTNLGKNNFIFIGSSTDVFANNIPNEWIYQTLDYCKKFKNKYLFQSKNVRRMVMFAEDLPYKSIIGTTIETNRCYLEMGNTVHPCKRAFWLKAIKKKLRIETFITIEPIMDFDLKEMIDIIKYANPDWVNIGADSGNNKLPEPSKLKINKLIKGLEKFTEIHNKDNLKRLIGK